VVPVKVTDSAVKDQGVKSNKSSKIQRSRYTGKIWQLTKKILLPNIKLKIPCPRKYTQNDYLKLLTYTGIHNYFAEGSSQSLRIDSSNGCPNADTLLYHLKKFEPQELISGFESAIDEIIAIAKKNGFLTDKIDIAIDSTDQLYYGDRNDPMVVGTKPQRGTSKAYRFATLTIVDEDCRLTIKAIPVDGVISKKEIVYKLVSYAKARININNVYLDRGFYSIDVISMLKTMDIHYIIPATLNPRIKKLLRQNEAPKIINNYCIGTNPEKNTLTNVVITYGKDGKKIAFITNLDVPRLTAHRIPQLYKKRWGIETSYRVINGFRPKTTSKNYIIRLFYFFFSVCLYDLWELVNIICSKSVQVVKKIPFITALLFGKALFHVLEIIGTGPPPQNNFPKKRRDLQTILICDRI
jgi:putative transposase